MSYKRVCDICGKDVQKYSGVYTVDYKNIFLNRTHDLCPDCYKFIANAIRSGELPKGGDDNATD